MTDTVEMLDLPPLRLPAVDRSAPVPRDRLPWSGPVQVEPAAKCGQGEFGRRLRSAGVLDLQAVELPGSAVVLPFGTKLMRRFEEVVRRHYDAHGFAEYDYPLLVPPSVLDPTRHVLDLDGRLLYAGADEDWQKGLRRAVLTPTGEAMVYTHWSRMVSTRRDLPIRMYRRARYFRPASSGQGLFRTIEAAGVWEFQACYADRAESAAGMVDAAGMAAACCADLHVPVLWSARPPWTNNEAVAEGCLGGDVPLPHGAALQVSCVYDQGDRFSRPYGVRWSDGTTSRHTRHVTGCVTQRLVLAHLFLGMAPNGDLLVHPDLAPTQVALTSTPSVGGTDDVDALVRLLAGLRVEYQAGVGKREVTQCHRTWRRQGVPVRGYVHSPRYPGDRVRVVLVRADTGAEAVVHLDEPARVAAGVRAAVAEVGVGYRHRDTGFVAGPCVPAVDVRAVREVLAAHRVAVCPLKPSEEAVRTVASWHQGEVLGFAAGGPGACVVTGRPTRARAYVSART